MIDRSASAGARLPHEILTGVKGILFDLFGTLVKLDGSRLPVFQSVRGPTRSTVPAYVELLAEVAPGIVPEDFQESLVAVSVAMAEARKKTHQETSSRERFFRALTNAYSGEALRAPGELESSASRLSLAHMAQLSAIAFAPPEHAPLLRRLGARFRIGCVSNFDHADTALEILDRTGLAPHLSMVVVSESFGYCKPARSIFVAGLRGLRLHASEVIFVGDTFVDDVHGATNAGMRAVWLNPRDVPAPPGETLFSTIRALPEIEALVQG